MPYPTFQANLPLTLTRRFAASNQLVVTVTNVSTSFRGRIYPPGAADSLPATDGSPRSVLSPFILWYKPRQAVGDINAGDRLYDGVDTWEVVRTVHGKRAGLEVLINECLVQKVSRLYPLSATLREQGGGATVEAVPMALWQANESDTGLGSYLAIAGEAPVEYKAALSVTNRELVVAGRVFRINDTILHLEQPHVAITLREGVRV